jgi:hypothetical protein
VSGEHPHRSYPPHFVSASLKRGMNARTFRSGVGNGSGGLHPSIEKRPLSFPLASFVAAVLAAETFYIVFDATLHGCTIGTAEPADKTRYKVLGTYKSEAEAEKAIASMKEC